MNLFIACLLLFAQTVSVVHATEHFFHEHSEFCDLADTVAQSDTLPAPEVQVPLTSIDGRKLLHVIPDQVLARRSGTIDIRAPPHA